MVARRAGGLGQRGPADEAQARRGHRNAERERVGPRFLRVLQIRRWKDRDLVSERRERRDRARAIDHDSRVGLLNDRCRHARRLILHRLRFIDGGAEQRVRQAEVALAQELVVSAYIAAELFAAAREIFVRRSEAGDVDVHEVRRAAHHPAAPIHPGLHRRAPPHQIALRAGLDKGETDTIARCRRGVGQLLAQVSAMLQVVKFSQRTRGGAKSRVRHDVADSLAREPDLPIVAQ